jgi:hypothetical protein
MPFMVSICLSALLVTTCTCMLSSTPPSGALGVEKAALRPSSASIPSIYPSTPHPAPSTLLFNSICGTNRPRCNEWRVPTAEVRLPAPARRVIIRFVTRRGLRLTAHILHRYTSLTTTHFSTSFVSIGHSFWVRTRVSTTVSVEESNGLGNAGGIDSPTFAKDGGTSSFDQRPIWASALFVHLAHLWQTCWHTHHPFHSSSITRG